MKNVHKNGDLIHQKVHDILKLTYLTGYNIKVINNFVKNNDSLTEADMINICINSLKKNNEKEISNLINSACEQYRWAIDKLRYYNILPISIFHHQYPAEIAKLPDAPPIIYMKGQFKECSMAAVIGSRQVSNQAERVTNRVVDKLIESGFGIVSGLAHGIDYLAHTRTLHKKGYTVAVMPNSLDTIYPKENYGLAQDILDNNGCLISELAFGINRGKYSFVQRNRLQAALSMVVIPIEMGANSGTMHTISFAKSQKKNLVLIAHQDINAPQYEGINVLVNQQYEEQNPNVSVVGGVNKFVEHINKLTSERVTVPYQVGEQLTLFPESIK